MLFIPQLKKLLRLSPPAFKELTHTSLGHQFLSHNELDVDYGHDAAGPENYITVNNFAELQKDYNKLHTVRDLLEVDSKETPIMGMVNGDTVVFLNNFDRLIVKNTSSKDVRNTIFDDHSDVYDYSLTIKTSQFHSYATISSNHGDGLYHFGIAPKSASSLMLTDNAHIRDESRHEIMYHHGHIPYNCEQKNHLFDYASVEVRFDMSHDQMYKLHEILEQYQQEAKQDHMWYNIFNNNCYTFIKDVFQQVYDTDTQPCDFYKSEEMDLRDKGLFQQFMSSRPWYSKVYNIESVFDLTSEFFTGKGLDELTYRWNSNWQHHKNSIAKLFSGADDDANDIFYYAANNDVKKLAAALEKNPNTLEIEDDYGYTPLHYALENSSFKTAKYLIEQGADLDKQDIRGFAAVQKIFEKPFIKHFWKIEPTLVKHYHGDYNTFDTKRFVTPLFSATKANKPEIIQWLIDHGADVSQKNTEYFNIAHTAGKAHKKEAFAFLKENYNELFKDIDARYNATPEQLFDEYTKFATTRATLEKIALKDTFDDPTDIMHFNDGVCHAHNDHNEYPQEMFPHIHLDTEHMQFV
jgi:hypothetical protein